MNKLYEESDIQAIADGIRKLTGGTGTYTVAQMGAAVSDYWGDFSPVAASVDENGDPYNNGLGYKLGYRTNSSGLEAEAADAFFTGFIPVVAGDIIRINAKALTGSFTPLYINMYDSEHTHLSLFYISSQFGVSYTQEIKIMNNVQYFRYSILGVKTAEDAEKICVKIIKGVST